MSAVRLLDEVRQHGGYIQLIQPSRLRVHAPTPLPAVLVESLRTHKPAIIAALQQALFVSDNPDPYIFYERAAIIEGDGVPHDWAEGFATLCTMSRPAAYTQRRWEQIINDGGLFLDQWKKQVVALGWQAVDVFGVCPDAPEWQYDQMGLVPLLEGRRVVAITADSARIMCADGAALTYYRKTMAAGSVILWKLGGK
ncbi:MAG: hypothetical protein PHD48_06325 [Alphaproteobacteria bacterium]|nr:hypothetical protein [Alphaproteobacteria bacterium]